MDGRPAVRGTCQTMCPIKEAQLRQREHLLHRLEMKRGTEGNRVPEFDPERIVKCFNRSAAGRDTTKPANLRPYPVLVKTIRYLYREIFPLHAEKPVFVYNFMFDRFRAVRQDAVIQDLPPGETVTILEPIVRFHMYFGYLLIGEDIQDFDAAINNTHLQECLERLLACYGDDENKSDNRWDVESAYLLLHLGNVNSLTRGIQLTTCGDTSEAFNECLKLSFHWHNRNYKRVFDGILRLPPLLLCIVSSVLPDVRRYCLHALAHAFSSQNSAYPVSHLTCLLLYESDKQTERECQNYNIKVVSGKINFLKKDFDSFVKCVKGSRSKWIDELLDKCNLVQLLCFGSNT